MLLVHLGGLLAALAVAIWGPPTVTGYDTSYAIAWARDLIRFQAPEAAGTGAGVPTPHPLALLMTLVVTGLHLPARATLEVLVVVAWAFSVIAFAMVAAMTVDRTASPPRGRAEANDEGTGHVLSSRGRLLAAVMAAVVTAALLALSPQIALLGLTASLDLVAVLAVGWAICAFMAGRRQLGVVLMTIGALQRPEIWVMLLVLLLLEPAISWLASTNRWAGEHPRRQHGPQRSAKSDSSGGPTLVRRSPRPRNLLGHAATMSLLCLTPAGWFLTGMLFGSPLSALTATRENSVALQRDTGIGAAASHAFPSIATAISWPATVLGAGLALATLAVLVQQAWSARPHAETTDEVGPDGHLEAAAALPGALFVLSVAAFIGQGLLGTALLARYLVLADFLCACLAGTAAGLALNLAVTPTKAPNWWRSPRWLSRWSTSAIENTPRTPTKPSPTGKRAPAFSSRNARVVLIVAASVAVCGLALHPRQEYRSLRATLAVQAGVHTSLREVLDREREACPESNMTAYTAVRHQIPVIADILNLSLHRTRPLTPASSADPGVAIYPRDLEAIVNAGFGPVLDEDMTDTFPIPSSYETGFSSEHWTTFHRC